MPQKGFMKTLSFMKVLWGTTKCENKKLIFVLIRINEMHGAWRINDDILQPRYIKFFWIKNQRHIHNPVKHLTGSFCGNSSRLKNKSASLTRWSTPRQKTNGEDNQRLFGGANSGIEFRWRQPTTEGFQP